jgi:hypothetical protein
VPFKALAGSNNVSARKIDLSETTRLWFFMPQPQQNLIVHRSIDGIMRPVGNITDANCRNTPSINPKLIGVSSWIIGTIGPKCP